MTSRGALMAAAIALACGASAVEAVSDPRDAFAVYRDRAEAPEIWDGAEEALRKAGVADTVVAIRPRPTALWSAHVDLAPPRGAKTRRAIVTWGERPDRNHPRGIWKVACLTSEIEDCSRFGR
jgi:hypothetical protein